jgi:NitT/TauT family transport system substrate-binding protein
MASFDSVLRLGVLAAAVAFGTGPVLAQSGAPANVRVAAMPVANFAALAVARDKGFFKDENLNVTWTTVPQGGIAVQAVFGGSAEVGGGSIFEPMIARGNGLDMVFIAANTRIRSAPPDNSGIVVRAEDNIQGPKDLVGKKVSASLLGGPNHVHMLEWLQRGGVDPAQVQFLEIPFPQMADALFQKRLDAVWNVEPFLTAMIRDGKAKVIAYPYQHNVPRMDITGFVAKESWVKANPDVAARFKRAIDKATNHLINAPKEERDEWVVKYSGLRKEVVTGMNLAEWTTEFTVPTLQANLDIAVRHKVAKPFNLNAMFWKP